MNRVLAGTVTVEVCTDCPMYHDGGQGAGPGDQSCNHPDYTDVFLPANAARPSDCPLLERPLVIRAKR